MARKMSRLTRGLIVAGVVGGVGLIATAAILELTFDDFHVPGTQMGMMAPGTLISSSTCSMCHGNFDAENEAWALWQGSLMGNAGRDPLFYAQMTLANQDVTNAGYYCIRCHVPNAIATGHAMPPDGSALSASDKHEGISCHLCHTMVDPVYQPGVSPPEDEVILNGLGADRPNHYGNAMFVLDPLGRRRSSRPDAQPAHEMIVAKFQSKSEMCGTCHEVGNVAVSRQPDGTFRYNAIGQASPSHNPHQQFPLERTYSEWKYSAFASGGVDMQGRFGGVGAGVVSNCQDCHMPKGSAHLSPLGPVRPDAKRHEFAGAAAQVLDLIALQSQNDPNVSQPAIAAARAAAVSMLERAASLQLASSGPALNVRVINESGHKLPTGHIEGRRVWVNVRFLNAAGQVIREHGHYDTATAELDVSSTTVYEMFVGLSAYAASVTGLQAGATSRMALADTIVKDNRIPPRGFTNAAYEAAGAPVVGAAYADGQHWSDEVFAVPGGTARAEVAVYYQNTPKEYIEHLKHANVTDTKGDELHALWTATGRGAPIRMASSALQVATTLQADFNRSGAIDVDDIFSFLNAWFTQSAGADFDANGSVAVADIFEFLNAWFTGT